MKPLNWRFYWGWTRAMRIKWCAVLRLPTAARHGQAGARGGFCDQEDQIKAATDAGADAVGGEDWYSASRAAGRISMRRFATPAMMRLVGRLGKCSDHGA